MGCVIYEIVTLKRPFDNENGSIPGLMYKVKNENFDPIPQITIPEIKQMIEEMLEKDPEKRPTIFELAKRPFLKLLIKNIISKSEYFENVEAFLNIEYLKTLNSPFTSKSTVISIPTKSPIMFNFILFMNFTKKFVNRNKNEEINKLYKKSIGK